MDVRLPNTLTDHPSLIGIIRLPSRDNNYYGMDIPVIIQDGDNFKNVVQPVLMCSNIMGYNGQFSQYSNSYTVPKNTITDFYPYTYYALIDGECEPLILHPQYMPSSIKITGVSALSHQPVERYFIDGYKGDDGRVYNITNLNQMMLPTGTNEGINYMNANANTIMQNRKSQVSNNILGAINSVGMVIGGSAVGGVAGGMATGVNAVSSISSGLNSIKESDSRQKDIALTPPSISSYGTPSTRDAFNNNNTRVIKYTITNNHKQKINNFVKRFGYKYNNYGDIDHKTYKGYLKMIAPDIDGKIDNMYINKITSILERGIYFE